MERHVRSPRIVHLSWGRLEVEGYPTFKDAKLYPGARPGRGTCPASNLLTWRSC